MEGGGSAQESQLRVLLTCPVCQDIFNDPHQLSCGHSLCLSCLEGMLQNRNMHQPFSCPTCRRDFGPLIGFHKSYTLHSIVDDFNTTAPLGRSPHSPFSEEEVKEKCTKDECTQTVPIAEPFSYLKYIQLLLPLTIMIICVCIGVNISAENHTLMETVQRQSTLLQECNPNKPAVTLNKDTASPLLVVSQDLLTVRRVKTPLSYPLHPARFTEAPQVLSSQCVSSGTHYWELEVKGSWDVAVVYGSIPRKTRFDSFGENPESWSLKHNGKGQLHVLHDGAKERLSKTLTHQRVGVILDFQEGVISFVEVGNSWNPLHTFKANIRETACLGLGLYKPDLHSTISVKHSISKP